MKTLKPNDLGNFPDGLCLEDCQRVRIKTLLDEVKGDMKKTLLNLKVDAVGIEIQLAETHLNFGGTRLWFRCPSCDQRRTILYKHPFKPLLGCRQCFGLKYRAQRHKGMIENDY